MTRLIVLVLAASACTSEISGAERGEEVFSSASLSPTELNIFTCATCHSPEVGDDVSDGLPGYRLGGAAARSLYWGSEYDEIQEAVDACLVFFMKGEALDPESDDFHALFEYLLSITPDGSPEEPYPFTVVESVVDVPRGDAGRGADVYQVACQTCHGDAFSANGSILGSEINLPGVTETYGELFPGVDPSLVVIEKIRHGRFFNIGGDMPLFSVEAMSDEDVGALLSFLEL